MVVYGSMWSFWGCVWSFCGFCGRFGLCLVVLAFCGRFWSLGRVRDGGPDKRRGRRGLPALGAKKRKEGARKAPSCRNPTEVLRLLDETVDDAGRLPVRSVAIRILIDKVATDDGVPGQPEGPLRVGVDVHIRES